MQYVSDLRQMSLEDEVTVENKSVRDTHINNLKNRLCEEGRSDSFDVSTLDSEDLVKCLSEKKFYFFIKRLFDICFSLCVIILFSWLFVLLAILIKLDDPRGPVFFGQKRVGKDGKVVSQMLV